MKSSMNRQAGVSITPARPASWKFSSRLTRITTSAWEEFLRGDCQDLVTRPRNESFLRCDSKHIILVPPIPQSKEATIEDAKIWYTKLCSNS